MLTRKLEHRLVGEFQTAVRERLTQPALKVSDLAELSIHLAPVMLKSAAASCLGPIKRNVGIAHQPLGGVAMVGEGGDPEAGAHLDLLLVDHERCFQRREHAARHLIGGVKLGDTLLEQRELVAAESGPGIAGASEATQTSGDLSQQRIARGMAEAIVDLLELVEVEQHYRHASAVAACPSECVPEAVVEQHPVREAGEGVVQRCVTESFLGDLALGDVDGGAHRADNRACRVANRRCAGELVEIGAVVEHDTQFLVAHDLAPRGALHRQPLEWNFSIVLVDAKVLRAFLVRSTQRLIAGGRHSQGVRGVAIPGDSTALGIMRQPDRDRNGFHHGFQLCCPGLEHAVGPFAGGDIAEYHLDDELAVDHHRRSCGLDGEGCSVQPAVGQLGEFGPGPRGGQCSGSGTCQRQARLIDQREDLPADQVRCIASAQQGSGLHVGEQNGPPTMDEDGVG